MSYPHIQTYPCAVAPPIKTKFKKITNILLSIILLCGVLIPSGLNPSKAHAESGDATLAVGRQIMYAGYSTGYFEVNNYGVPAYCGNPSLKTPAPGNYTSVDLYINGGDNGSSIDQLAKIIYYGWGGPGFDASLYPSTWYDGSAMTNDNYHALTHILVSQYFADDASAALKGTKQAFKDWYYNNIAPYVPTEGTGSWDANPSSTAWAITSMSIPEGFVDQCFVIQTGSSTQAIVGYNPTAAPQPEPEGEAGVQKVSTYPEMTQGNNMYSLAGAQFLLNDDAATTLTTDDNGSASASGVKPGNYSLTEQKAPKGFALNTESYPLAVTGGVATVEIPDKPQNDPAGALVQKLDKLTGLAEPEGDATLEGAEFTVKYYDNPNGDVSGTPLKTYVFATNADGWLRFSDKYQVAGDAMYRINGSSVMPLGTYSVQETKAPTGYLLPSPTPIHVATLISTGSNETDVQWTYLDSWNSIELNEGIVPDKVQQGDYRLVKEVSTDVNNENPNGTAPTFPDNSRILVPGIQFQLINDSAHPVLSPETGQLVDPGNVVATITTDQNGLASTRNYLTNGWSLPSGFTAALAYGTYIVHEIIPDSVNAKFKAQYGFDVPHVADWKTTIRSEMQYDAPMLVNDKAQTPLKIVKQDAETGKQIPRVAGFQLFKDGKQVTYTYHYPDTQVIDTFYTNERGEVTLPMFLNPGDYEIREVQAPEGYTINKDPIRLHVDSSFSNWDHPAVVEMKDMPIKGKIHITKYDSDTNGVIAKADYTIKAREDIVTPDGTVRAKKDETVATLTTDDKGEAVSDLLYLGKYYVYETKSPEGYALDTAEHDVVIVSQGQDIPVVDVQKDLYDNPSKLKVLKTNAENGNPVAGAEFRIWQDGADEVKSYDTSKVAGAIQEKLGAQSTDLTDMHAFEVAVQTAKPGDEIIFSASSTLVNNVQISNEFVAHLQDDYTILITYKSPSEAKAKGDVATIAAKITKNENSYDETFITDDKGEINLSYIKHGAYHLLETKAALGYHLTDADKQIDFVVDDQGFVGRIGENFKDVLVLNVSNTPDNIHTTATVEGLHEVEIAEDIELTDTVEYHGVAPGKEYTVTGTLHVGELHDGTLKDSGVVVDKDGNYITAETTFIPDTTDGTVEVIFHFDGSIYAGKSIVAFEEMTQDGKLFAAHADINDKAQTVTFKPSIKTTLTDKETGTHTSSSEATTHTLIDTVEYKGLTPDHEYTMEGTLHNSDGTLVIDKDSKEVVAKTTFTPEKTNGTVDIEFTFELADLAGKSVVAFEEVSDENGSVATHADIDDKGQTVTFPSVKTTAVDAADEDHEVEAIDNVKITDTVSYTGLTPGQEYTVSGTLIDKETNQPVKDGDGNNVVGKTVFTPDAPDGTVEVDFTFDASKLSGHETVVFEDLYHGSVETGIKIASHADIDDKNQTVTVKGEQNPSEKDSSTYAKTGDVLHNVAPLALVIIIFGIAGAVYGIRQRRAALVANDQQDTSETDTD